MGEHPTEAETRETPKSAARTKKKKRFHSKNQIKSAIRRGKKHVYARHASLAGACLRRIHHGPSVIRLGASKTKKRQRRPQQQQPPPFTFGDGAKASYPEASIASSPPIPGEFGQEPGEAFEKGKQRTARSERGGRDRIQPTEKKTRQQNHLQPKHTPSRTVDRLSASPPRPNGDKKTPLHVFETQTTERKTFNINI